MTPAMVSYKDIDPVKWNRCIHQSRQRLIYGDYDYWKHMAGNWKALILGDYEAVMPFACNIKWGFHYVYQPAFLQQTGIFSAQPISLEIAMAFWQELIKTFSFIEINLHPSFPIDFLPHDMVRHRNNFVLSLKEDYDKISKSYNSNLRQRVNKSKRNGLVFCKLDNVSIAINTFKQLYQQKMKGKDQDYENFNQLCHHYQQNESVIIRGVKLEGTDALMACVLMLKDENRIYNLASSLFPEGKKLLANYFLYDQIIQEFAEHEYLFDFEGSDEPGIADFYQRFPVQKDNYIFLRYNHLPLPLRWLKKR